MHQLLAQVNIFMQILYIVMHSLYKVVIYLHGHLSLIQRGLKRRCIAPCLRVEYKRLHLRVKEGGRGVLKAFKRMIQRLERGLPHIHVRAFKQRHE